MPKMMPVLDLPMPAHANHISMCPRNTQRRLTENSGQVALPKRETFISNDVHAKDSNFG